MLSDVIRLHLSNHDGLTVSEITADLYIEYGTCSSIVQNLRKNGLCQATERKPRKYKSEKHEAMSQVIDEYVYRVIAREGFMTVDDVHSLTYLSKYRIGLSLKRLKNLGKISTLTGQGVSIEVYPSQTNRRAWKTSEINYLRENLGKLPISKICEVLNRTARAVNIRAHQLGMSTVSRCCKKGHRLSLRNTGKWVCNECHCERERIKRNVACVA